MKFSLIVATINRKEELSLFLNSLTTQSYTNFEVIIIDQNKKGFLSDIISSFQDKINIIHVYSEKGLSIARNVGLRLVSGDIYCFPDDDCWYFPDTLNKVYNLFIEHIDLIGVTGRCVDDNGNESVAKFLNYEVVVNKKNVFSTAVSVTLFVKKNDNIFNENLGAGSNSIYGSGEETDYVLKLLKNKAMIKFCPNLIVGHPNVLSVPNKNRAFQYGCGMGYLLRKYKYGILSVLGWILKPLLGACFYVIKFNFIKANFYIHTFMGRIFGYVNAK